MRNLGVVTLTFLGQNIEAFENMFYCISTTYEILSPIKKTKSADN